MQQLKKTRSNMSRSKILSRSQVYKTIGGLAIVIALILVLLNLQFFASWISSGAMEREDLLAQGRHLHSLAVVTGDPETILVGAHEGLFKSTDGGKTWEEVPGTATKTDIMGLYIHRKSGSVIYASGHDIGIMKSMDGGKSWISLVRGLPERPDVHAMTSNPNNPDEVYVWVVGAGLFKSSDGGKRWSLISPGLAKVNVFSLAVHPEKSGTLYAGTNGGLLITQNDGFTWKPVKEKSLEKLLISLLINPENPKVIFGGTQEGMIKTTDGGLTWSSVEGVREGVMALARHPIEPKVLYGLTIKGNVLKSQDGGNTWR